MTRMRVLELIATGALLVTLGVVAAAWRHRVQLEAQLVDAAERGDVKLVRRLLDQGVDPNARTSDHATALTGAVREWQVEVTELLLDRGADPNLEGAYGGLPLEGALVWAPLRPGKTRTIVMALLKRGADVDRVPVVTRQSGSAWAKRMRKALVKEPKLFEKAARKPALSLPGVELGKRSPDALKGDLEQIIRAVLARSREG